MEGILAIVRREKERLEKEIAENIAAHRGIALNLPEGFTIEFTDAPCPPSLCCAHEFVNVSFSHLKMVCKHCDQEQ